LYESELRSDTEEHDEERRDSLGSPLGSSVLSYGARYCIRVSRVQVMKRFFTVAVLVAAGLSALGQMQTYCTNIAGNIACTSYDNGSSSQSYCTSIGDNLSCTTYSHTDQYNQVQVQQNYAAGYAIGTALGNAVVAAIQEYREHRRGRQEKQDAWNQFVQDVLASVELHCEVGDHANAPESPEDCRAEILTLNQFFHRHQKDFVVDHHNMGLLVNALENLEKQGSSEQEEQGEQILEKAYRLVDRKQLDKKMYLGEKTDRRVWDGHEPLTPNTAAWTPGEQP
jgi:hypothetical protein